MEITLEEALTICEDELTTNIYRQLCVLDYTLHIVDHYELDDSAVERLNEVFETLIPLIDLSFDEDEKKDIFAKYIDKLKKVE